MKTWYWREVVRQIQDHREKVRLGQRTGWARRRNRFQHCIGTRDLWGDERFRLPEPADGVNPIIF